MVQIAKLLLGVRSEDLRVFGRNSSETDSETVSEPESETDSENVSKTGTDSEIDSEPASKQNQDQNQNHSTESVITFRTIKSDSATSSA
jgi:hypothetical protein